MNKAVVEPFAREFYLQDLQAEMFWRGRHLVKNPCDLWVMVEILAETKPDLILETGCYEGASAHFYTEMTELLYGGAKVVSVDIHHNPDFDYPHHDSMQLLLGASSTDPRIVKAIRDYASKHERVMVILDSDHSRDHVLNELRLYAPLVTVGQYLVVEDTNPLAYEVIVQAQPNRGKGPAEALEAFRPTEQGFEVDRRRERFGLTFHPGGYLRRIDRR